MNSGLLSIFSSVFLGSIIIVNGVVLNVDDILNNAQTAVDAANLHQLATVIELYYADHNTYPPATNGEGLIALLENESYILNRPLNPETFKYTHLHNGQDYRLSLNK